MLGCLICIGLVICHPDWRVITLSARFSARAASGTDRKDELVHTNQLP